MTEPTIRVARVAHATPASNDEIRLTDLWLVLVRRKAVVLAVLAVAALVGAALTLSATPTYTYTTSVEIGSRLVKEQVTVIESPDTVLAKLTQGYIPIAQQQLAHKYPEDEGRYPISARIPRGSQLVILTSEGPAAQRDRYVELHEAVLDMLREDHRRGMETLRSELGLEISEIRSKLGQLEDEATVLAGQQQRVDRARSLVLAELEALRDLIATATARQGELAAAGEPAALTMLMMDNELQQYHERRAELEERAQIELADERDRLAKTLSDNRRQQGQRAAELEAVEARLANLQETRAFAPPMQSLQPVQPNSELTLALSAVLGLMLGVMAAFFAEFLHKARLQAARQQVADPKPEPAEDAADSMPALRAANMR